jgi:7-cyano-7-deazaguanine synthase in queuosine biosynthesis
MESVLVLCDHVSPPPHLDPREFHTLSINQYSPQQNLRLQVWNVSHWLLKRLEPASHDLLEIATFVYYADNSIRRGTIRNVFNDNWVRDFTFVIPVRKPEIWQQPSIRTKLSNALEFLTEDRFEFVFVKRRPRPEQLAFRAIREALPPCPEADCVSLFSGGMDSLAGAVHLYANERKPVLVSHKSRSVLAHLQDHLARPIRQRLSGWDFPHVGIWINRKGQAAVENTQRSRSFLYFSLGAVVAYELELSELVICENGITTFNLPRLGQTMGALATRSTHPRFVHLFHQLIDEALNARFQITTPFLWRTRAEVLKVLKENDCTDLLPLSSSCNESRRSKIHPHCGVCSQCVDRRFAVTFAGLDGLEGELEGYEKDIFTDALDEGPDRTQAWSIVRFALDLQQRDVDSFCKQYGEVYEAVDSLPGDPEQTLQAAYDLHERFATEVDAVMAAQHSRHWKKMYQHGLPENCLLMLTGPTGPRLPDPETTERAQDLIRRLRECPVGQSKLLEDVCEEVLIFLFCEGSPPEQTLRMPDPQSATDQGYERRDLLFENRATEGLWAEIRYEYDAVGIIVDAKNYDKEIDGATVADFSSKYLKDYGVGRFGVIVAREVPSETKSVTSIRSRVPSAVKKQKDEWRDSRKMIVLLGEEDLVEMLEIKAKSYDPTKIIRDRVFTLRSRM